MYKRQDSVWTENGIKDLKHLGEKIKRHKISETHMNNCIKYSLLGKVNTIAKNKTDSAPSGSLWRSFLKAKTGSGYKVKLLNLYP